MTWYPTVLSKLRKAGFKVNDIPCIWTKGGAGQTASPDTTLGSSYEPFFVCRKGSPSLTKAGRSNVFDFKPVPPSKKIHATEKPLDLMVEILDTFTLPGMRILVPFLGSGVTLRAAFVNKHFGRCWGWDLSSNMQTRFLGKVMEDQENGLY